MASLSSDTCSLSSPGLCVESFLSSHVPGLEAEAVLVVRWQDVYR